jgi:hypothetical protein
MPTLPEQFLTLNRASTRILITTNENPALFWEALEYLLCSSWCKHLLVLSPTASRAELLQTWHIIPFLNERHFGRKRFPLQFAPAVPLQRNTRICIATIRELQAQQEMDCTHTSSHYDCVVIYQVPCTLSPLWMQVLEHIEGIPVVGFGENPSPVTSLWFRNLAERENAV